jgi:hypothetical protein
MNGNGRRASAATVLFAVVVAELGSVVVGWAAVGMAYAVARDSFMISNAAIGGCCAGCGVLIARHRPENRLGRLLLGAGVAQTGTAAVTPWFVQALVTDAPVGLDRALSTVYSLAWPWSVAAPSRSRCCTSPTGACRSGPPAPSRRSCWSTRRSRCCCSAPTSTRSTPSPGSSCNPTAAAPRGLRVPALERSVWVPLLSDGVLVAGFAAGLVLDLLAAGLSTTAIATRLGIAPKTVSNNLSTIFTKLGATNRTEAALQATRAGLGAPSSRDRT